MLGLHNCFGRVSSLALFVLRILLVDHVDPSLPANDLAFGCTFLD